MANDRPNRKGLNRGSIWHRWEPHVHTPGTMLNDQFGGEEAWPEYLAQLEASNPPIRALGVTDYYSTDAYTRVCKEKARGRLSGIELIFPNVELRLDVGTMRGRWVNVHLLVSPEDSEHLDRLHQFLTRLRFRAFNESFSCTREDLIRLGKAAYPRPLDDQSALRHGVGQFKVNFDQLREAYEQSDWAQSNILIAVAGSKTDGTSGVRNSADATLREEMETFADLIFASSPAQREFWLGQRDIISAEDINTRYGGLKPCLHGSDAHETSKTGKPDKDRRSWVKGGLEFDALRQACIDPAGRAFVGSTPPKAGTPSQLIDQLVLSNAPWAKTPELAFNSGLVAVIGVRGSGKTALVEMIARACDAIPEKSEDEARDRPISSFLDRAGELLGDAEINLKWRDGETAARKLGDSSASEVTYSRARYLSQQFVDKLCSANNMTDALLREIERVIFEAHPLTERDGTLNFTELLELRASRYRFIRAREEAAIVNISGRVGAELLKVRLVDTLTKDIATKEHVIAAYTADRKLLVSKNKEARVKRLTEITEAAEKVRGYIRYFSSQEQSLLSLQDEVSDLRTNQAPEMLRGTQERHSGSHLKPEDWASFQLDYTGDVDAQLSKYLQNCRKAAKLWKGTAPVAPCGDGGSYIPANTELQKLPLATLEIEIARLEILVSEDKVIQKKFSSLSAKILDETTTLSVLREKLEDANEAQSRANKLYTEREVSYKRVFEAITSEQQVLIDLYEPLMTRLSGASGTLAKMTFAVSRTADVIAWAECAETDLVDLRRQGPFRGKGKLSDLAEEALREAWESGDADSVSHAMAYFREMYQDDLLKHAIVSKAEPVEHQEWLKRFAHWLFSTDHISLNYGIDFDGVDIRKLSPGTSGIVLLLLYLALDHSDDRPLIIDQPEENLDPKSVYDELVDLFIEAKGKRQVILVTHNANLVVNTDADQIIIAEANNHESGSLPDITYTSGGLENAKIRKTVCDILEGGETAFRERARRLRVKS